MHTLIHYVLIATPVCPQCGLKIAYSQQDIPQAIQSCGYCLQYSPPFDSLISAFAYHAPVDRLISAFKFQHQLSLAALFSHGLIQQINQRGIGNIEAILPVPLHPQRLRQRGYNQALELALPLANYFSLPLLTHAVYRQRATKTQSRLDIQQRKTNMRHAFALREPLPFSHIALVDDVVTTGSTVAELARLLKQSGVETVTVWCAARAQR